MTTIRVSHNREHPFVLINKTGLRDPNLSLKAKGLWGYMLSFPDDWEFNMAHLTKNLQEGRTAIANAMDELSNKGYMVKIQCTGRNEDGSYGFQKNITIVFEFPVSKEEQQIIIKDEIEKAKGRLIQKKFVKAGFMQTVNMMSESAPLLNKEREINKEDKNIYAPPKGSANEPPPPSLSDSKRKRPPPKPKVPFRTATLISRLPDHPSNGEFIKHFNLPLISTSEAHHETLVKENGEDKVIKAYNHLAEWKLSKAQSEPNAVPKHADYYRITTWVMKEILDSLPGGSRTYQRSGKLAISADQRAKEEKHVYKQANIIDEAEKRRLREVYEKMKKDAQVKELKEKELV